MLGLDSLDAAVGPDEEVAQVDAGQVAHGSRAEAIELDVLEQKKSRRDTDRVLSYVRGGEGEEAAAPIAAENDETERAPLDRIEQQIDRPAETDPVELHRKLQQLRG
jgi:hypothetical protein